MNSFFMVIGFITTCVVTATLLAFSVTMLPDFVVKIRSYRRDEAKLAELRARIAALEGENEALKRTGYRA
jgi:hypothetical protein